MSKNIIFLCIGALLLSGCASNPFSSYKETSDETFNKIYSGQIATAIAQKNTPDILYNMEYGMLLRLNQQYNQSNIYFGRAQEVIDIWTNSWANTTAGQLSSDAVSMLINDNAEAYQPKGYEKSFLATFYALNQLDLNSFDNARVEIKQMYEIEQATQNYNQALYNKEEIEYQKESQDATNNYLYKQIIQKYDFSDINSPQVLALKNSYQNAFSHYLAGFVFEALNEPSLSRPGYVKAGQLNPTSKLIQQSIDNLDNGVTPKAGSTDLLIVEEIGHAPQIQSISQSIPINLNLVHSQNSCVNVITIFYPKLVLDTKNEPSYTYLLDTQQMTPEPMVNVNLMAARALFDQTRHIIMRNVAAAIRNIAAAQASCSAQGTLGAMLNLGTAFTGMMLDRADERAWTLLPAYININRTTLPYGKHTITVNVNGSTYSKAITLNQPYQVINFRIIGNQVLFDPQNSMLK